MEFNEYLKICRTYLGDGEFIVEFMSNFFGSITIDDNGKTNFSCPFIMKKDASKARKAYSGERDLSRNDAIFIKGHFREEVLYGKIEELPETVLQSLIDDLYKYGIEATLHNAPEVMCSVFREILDERINSQKKISKKLKNYDESKNICCDEKTENNYSESSNNATRETSDSNSYEFVINETEINYEKELEKISNSNIDIARNFCIDYEDEIELLPLCQVAFSLKPRHKHIRKMYTEYIRLNEEARKAIMYMNEIPIYDFEKEWQYDLLGYFVKDVEKYKLSDRDMFYDGGKYFHNASKYPSYSIEDPDPFIFPATPNFRPKGPVGNLMNYIDEYIFYQGNKEAMKYVGEPPLAWMIYNLDLLECPEDDMMFWMNLFVYSACHVLVRYTKNPSRKYNSFYVPNLYELKTLEDYYYAALLSLYETYCC